MRVGGPRPHCKITDQAFSKAHACSAASLKKKKTNYKLQRNPGHLEQTSIVESSKDIPAGGSKLHWVKAWVSPLRPLGQPSRSATMNLERVSNEEKLNLCRKYYLDVWRSAVGFLFWVIVLTTWITIFQIYRPRWGALGDYLSFTIPLGTP
nr:gamma-secretase subunit PEN-2 isoform X2 [Microcebus murinus]